MPADKRQERKTRFKLDMVIGNKEYFLRQASSGLVGGPKSRDGVDRHITVAVDPETELIRHVHMKSGRGGNLREDWRLHPERIMSDVNSWIRRNSVSLAASEIPRIDKSSYVVSARRILITYHILEALVSKIFWIFVRGFRFIPLQVVRGDREIRVGFVVDPQQLARRVRRFRPLLRPVKAILPRILPGLLKRVAKLQLVRVKDMTDGDVSVVLSREGAEPIVVVKQQQECLSVKLERVFQAATNLYSRFKIADLQPDFNSSDKPTRMQLVARSFGEEERS